MKVTVELSINFTTAGNYDSMDVSAFGESAWYPLPEGLDEVSLERIISALHMVSEAKPRGSAE
jgi:hypothetical protein